MTRRPSLIVTAECQLGRSGALTRACRAKDASASLQDVLARNPVGPAEMDYSAPASPCNRCGPASGDQQAALSITASVLCQCGSALCSKTVWMPCLPFGASAYSLDRAAASLRPQLLLRQLCSHPHTDSGLLTKTQQCNLMMPHACCHLCICCLVMCPSCHCRAAPTMVTSRSPA